MSRSASTAQIISPLNCLIEFINPDHVISQKHIGALGRNSSIKIVPHTQDPAAPKLNVSYLTSNFEVEFTWIMNPAHCIVQSVHAGGWTDSHTRKQYERRDQRYHPAPKTHHRDANGKRHTTSHTYMQIVLHAIGGSYTKPKEDVPASTLNDQNYKSLMREMTTVLKERGFIKLTAIGGAGSAGKALRMFKDACEGQEAVGEEEAALASPKERKTSGEDIVDSAEHKRPKTTAADDLRAIQLFATSQALSTATAYLQGRKNLQEDTVNDVEESIKETEKCLEVAKGSIATWKALKAKESTQ